MQLPDKTGDDLSVEETGGSVTDGSPSIKKSIAEEQNEGRDVLCGLRLGFDGVFTILSITFIVCVSISCVAEEAMYKHLPDFNYFWTVAFAELLTFTAMSLIGVVFFSPDNSGSLKNIIVNRKAPIKLYILQAIVMAVYAAIAKIAYKYLNYATGTVLRSTKLVFVIGISIVWLGRKYSYWEYGSCFTMIVAVACFGLGEGSSSGGDGSDSENHLMGYVLSIAGLGLAALQTNMADNAMRDHGASTLENMLFVNSIGLLVVAVVAGLVDGKQAFFFFRDTPNAMNLLVARSLTFYCGALVCTELTRHSGATPATTVATARKGVTIVASFILFPGDKAMSVWFAAGIGTFGVAIGLELKARLVNAQQRKGGK
ncbi:DMT family transporter [bacterium]|nr:DMT family transporter [bacterium]